MFIFVRICCSTQQMHMLLLTSRLAVAPASYCNPPQQEQGEKNTASDILFGWQTECYTIKGNLPFC